MAEFPLEKEDQSLFPRVVATRGQSAPKPQQYEPQQITRLFDPNQYLSEMQSAVGGRDNDLKMLRGLGMALQFQNPNFNASAFINNYKSNELAQIQNKWELLTAADKQGVERQLSQQMMDWSNANPAATDSDFRAWWDKLGFPNMSAMERTHKAWRQVNPLPELSKSMGFIDKEGLKHLGYVQYDKDRIPRYFLRDGSKVPEGWDMISPTATNVTTILGKQGEKMGEARQIAMAKMSRKWSRDAAQYWFDETGNFKADTFDILQASSNFPKSEGRLVWAQMRNALANALRLESGAVISAEEEGAYKERFFPSALDNKETVIWKLRAFDDYIRTLEEINNPKWVQENLPYPAWNPKSVRTEKERDALPAGSYFTTPNGNLGRIPHPSDDDEKLK